MFELNLITKSATLEEALLTDNILIPSPSGPVNLLPRHTHLISVIVSGIIEIKIQEECKKYFVNKGVCKIIDNKVTILCDVCEGPKEINQERLQQSIKQLKEKVQNKNLSMEEYSYVAGKLKRAQFRQELLRDNGSI